MALASQTPSPAPMSTPSMTNTSPESGCPMATTRSPAAMAACTSASGVNSGARKGRVSRSRAPRTTPPSTPQRSISAVASRAFSRSPAPRDLPVMACAAMARASRAKAKKVQIVAVTW